MLGLKTTSINGVGNINSLIQIIKKSNFNYTLKTCKYYEQEKKEV